MNRWILLMGLMLLLGGLGGEMVSGGIVIERRIASGTDDVEERLGDGSIDVTSSDLEIPYEDPGRGRPQAIGLRFVDVAVPADAIITAAWLQFEVDETKDDQPVSLLIEGELDPNPVTFSDAINSVTSRARTDANAVWDVPIWEEVSAQGPDQRSSDLTPIIQEIVSQEGWASGNAIVLIVRDDPDNPSEGVRTAESYSLPSGAPLLHIEIFGTSATDPVPADGAVGVTPASLTWSPGDTAVSHDVYFGTDPALGPDTYQERQGQAALTLAEALTPGQTYYWRVDEVEADGTTVHVGSVWSFTAATVAASGPLPPAGAKWIDTEADLSWTAGLGAQMHEVYFGTDPALGPDTFQAAQEGTTFDPGPLAENTTYFWRVDEIEADGTTRHVGDVWQFGTAGPGGGILGEYYNFGGGAPPNPPEAAFDELILTRVDPQILFDWGDSPAEGVNADLFAVKWVGEVEAAFSEPYRFSTTTDDGLKLWVDGQLLIDNWTLHGSTVDTSAPIELEAGPGHTLEMWWFENNSGAVAQLSWESPSTPLQPIPPGALSVPLRARAFYPRDRATETAQNPLLRWFAGEKAGRHDIYFGTDQKSVGAADVTTAGVYLGRQELDAVTYDPGPLEPNTTYYWRIDEVNEAEADGPWLGRVWFFTTADYLIIDDFERYTDDPEGGQAVFDTWGDGWTNETGSQVGYTNAPFTEQTIVHGGRQSMPLIFGNRTQPYYSEIERAWSVPQDWTAVGGEALSLYVQGSDQNASEDLYVAIEDTAGHIAQVTYPAATVVTEWTEWRIPLTDLSAAGVDLTAVARMFLGVGDRDNPVAGGAGRLFIDDIVIDGPDGAAEPGS